MIPDIRIKYNGVNVRLVGWGFTKLHNLRILETGLESMKARFARGLGVDDGPAKPLTKKYARFKAYARRKKAVRDLDLTGKLLSELQPRYADDRIASADASTRLGRTKLRSPYNIESFLWSPNDQKNMLERATELFTAGVQQTIRTGRNLDRAAGPMSRDEAKARRTQVTNRKTYFGRSA